MSQTTQAPRIRGIRTDGDHAFIIDWTTDVSRRYILSELQRHCPCAACWDTELEQRRPEAGPVADQQRAKGLRNVGHYALQVDFASGCSNGIYRFDELIKWGEQL